MVAVSSYSDVAFEASGSVGDRCCESTAGREGRVVRAARGVEVEVTREAKAACRLLSSTNSEVGAELEAAAGVDAGFGWREGDCV